MQIHLENSVFSGDFYGKMHDLCTFLYTSSPQPLSLHRYLRRHTTYLYVVTGQSPGVCTQCPYLGLLRYNPVRGVSGLLELNDRR